MKSKKGQSLIELILGVAIGALLVGAAAAALSVTLRSSSGLRTTQTALYLGKELMNEVRAYAARDWKNAYFLSRVPAVYYLVSAGTGFATSSGSEEIILNETAYTRSFTLEDVIREAVADPGLLEVQVNVLWNSGGIAAGTTTLHSRIARRGSEAIAQTDWSGGPVDPAPITPTLPAVFASSTKIDYGGTPGAVKVEGF